MTAPRHTAIGMMDHKTFLRAQQLLRNYQRPNRVVAGPAAGITDQVRVTFG
ncbi:MAG: hypothetical protein JO333_10000 [Verrucomicrobia bacterium]|nr:hypothetical protein [Verrucomicrobiota bacterium]